MRAIFASLLLSVSIASLGAFAADIDLSVKNPAIEKLRARMNERTAKLAALKDKGAIGEDAGGLLSDRQIVGLSLAEKKDMRDLVAAENEDRSAFFREIRIAHNLPDSDLGKIAAAFATQQRAGAAPNHQVQNPADLKWVAKKDLK